MIIEMTERMMVAITKPNAEARAILKKSFMFYRLKKMNNHSKSK
jgi:hypothetical protein